jgi:hypothetical protein
VNIKTIPRLVWLVPVVLLVVANSRLPRWRFSASSSTAYVRDSLLAWLRCSRCNDKVTLLVMAAVLNDNNDCSGVAAKSGAVRDVAVVCWRSLSSAIRTTSRLIAVLGSFANGVRRTPPPMRAAACAKGFSKRPIRRARSGPTPLTDRPPTKSSWKRSHVHRKKPKGRAQFR